jgi:uncharacterized protein YjbI with pentapeptide repeats
MSKKKKEKINPLREVSNHRSYGSINHRSYGSISPERMYNMYMEMINRTIEKEKLDKNMTISKVLLALHSNGLGYVYGEYGSFCIRKCEGDFDGDLNFWCKAPTSHVINVIKKAGNSVLITSDVSSENTRVTCISVQSSYAEFSFKMNLVQGINKKDPWEDTQADVNKVWWDNKSTEWKAAPDVSMSNVRSQIIDRDVVINNKTSSSEVARLKKWATVRKTYENDLDRIYDIIDNHKAWLKDHTTGNQADLSNEDLRGMDLNNVNLQCAYLSGTNLSNSYLNGANLSETCLEQANLYKANLTGADLTGADLTGAEIDGVDFTNANLTGANLTGAEIDGADFTNANLTDVIGLDKSKINTHTTNTNKETKPKEKIMSNGKNQTAMPTAETALDFAKTCLHDGMWRSVGDNTVKHAKDVICTVLKNKGADDGTMSFVGELLDSKEGEAAIAGFLAALLHFGPQYIPMIPEQIKSDPRVARLAKEYGTKASAEGMTIVYKELTELALPIFAKLATDLASLPPAETNVRIATENSTETEETTDDSQSATATA